MARLPGQEGNRHMRTADDIASIIPFLAAASAGSMISRRS
jgi:hypothetical protein